MAKQNDLNLIWLDLEMTGLDVENDVIVEIATIVTDKELNILGEGPVHAIKTAEDKLANMGDWVKQMHTASGLIERIKESNISLQTAEQETLQFISQFVPSGKSPMCGNSICMDRRFLHRYMPELEKYFHYRHVDVSTIKELASRWKPDIINGIVKQGNHRALDDIRESIDELIYYRTHLFNI